MLIRNVLISFCGLVLLTACQTVNRTDPNDSAASVIPAGSSIILNQPLTFDIGFSRSYIQHGKALHFKDVRTRYPYCYFYRYEPRKALQAVRTVPLGQFKVIHSYQTMEVASTSFMQKASMDDGYAEVYLSSIMELESPSQPEINKLICSVFGEQNQWNYVSVNQIKKTLGGVAEIILSTD